MDIRQISGFFESRNERSQAFHATLGKNLIELVDKFRHAHPEADWGAMVTQAVITHATLFEEVFSFTHDEFLENPHLMNKVNLSNAIAVVGFNAVRAAADNYPLDENEQVSIPFITAALAIGIDIVVHTENQEEIERMKDDIDSAVDTDEMLRKLGLGD